VPKSISQNGKKVKKMKKIIRKNPGGAGSAGRAGPPGHLRLKAAISGFHLAAL